MKETHILEKNWAGPLNILQTIHDNCERMKANNEVCTYDQSQHYLYMAAHACAMKLKKMLQADPDDKSCVYFQPGRGKLNVGSNFAFGSYKILLPYSQEWRFTEEAVIRDQILAEARKLPVLDNKTGCVEFVLA